MEWYEKFEKIREFVSDEEIVEAMMNYFNSDQIDEFCEELIVNNGLESEFIE